MRGSFSLIVAFSLTVASTVSMEVQLSDNVNFNTKVANLANLDPSLPKPDSSQGYLSTLLTPYQSYLDGFFTIDKHGTISSNRDNDRDELCGKLGCCDSPECRLDYTATVTLSSGGVHTRNFQLVLRDENDQTPNFPSAGPIDIPEDARVDSEDVRLPSALDKDSPKFSVKSYNLTDPSGTFTVVLKSGVPFLKLLKPLDRESVPQYQVTLRASDGEHEGLVVVTIRVGDINDNNPVFDRAFVSSIFSESKEPGSKITTLTASDKDAGPNAKVRFSIPSVNPPELKEFFTVRSESGFWGLYLNQSLDYEIAEQRAADVYVEVRDQGVPPRSSTGTVRIQVTDTNDNAPVIKELATHNLYEHQDPEFNVKTIQVTDADSVSRGQVSCKLESNPKFRLQKNTESSPTDTIEQATYNLDSTTSFDYEVAQEETVNMVCLDSASPEKVTTQTFVIPIRETNDFKPTFAQSNYFVKVYEDWAIGRTVLKVSATDQDKGSFSEVNYELDANGQRNFSIDNTGNIDVRVPLDRERAQNLRFTVTAKDRGGLADTATVVVELLDVNDNDPQYTGPPSVTVAENSPLGTLVAQVSFADPDAGENGTVDFELSNIAQSIGSDFLSLYRNGSLVVRRSFDRETNSKFLVSLTAWDMGLRRRSSTATLEVNVGDINDCPPKVVKPRSGALLGIGSVLFTNVPRKTLIVTVEAEDPDAGENGTVAYRLVASNASGMFDIDSQRGEIHSMWNPDEAPPMPGLYFLTVQLSDLGRPVQLSSETTFYVRLTAPPTPKFDTAGVSGLIILILIIAGTVVIAVGLIVAICYVRGRANDPISTDAMEIEARAKMSEDFHGYRESPVPYDTRLLQQQHQQHQQQQLLHHQVGTLKRQQQDYFAWSRPGSPLTMMSLQGEEAKQLYRPYMEIQHRSDYLPMEHVSLTCGRSAGGGGGAGGGGNNTFARIGCPHQQQQQHPQLAGQAKAVAACLPSPMGAMSGSSAAPGSDGASAAGLGLHERRHSEEDASVDDSGRGGSMEDMKMAAAGAAGGTLPLPRGPSGQHHHHHHVIFRPDQATAGTMI